MAEALAGKPDVLVTIGTPGALAAKKATSTVPIVVAVMGDPVHSGVVSNLARPEGNLTAISTGYSGGFPGKWLELLLEVRPRTKTVAVLWNLGNPVVQAYRDGLERAAVARRVKLYFIDVRKREELESAFRQAKRVAQAGVVVPENLVINNRPLVVGLATKYRLPTIYGLPEFVQDGGLISYGTDMRVMARRGAEYVDKILRGAKPADLPVQEPVTFLLSVNLTSAKALGITIPESILSRADEVIK
jgi:putative ABC transport system substrate-binding protein